MNSPLHLTFRFTVLTILALGSSVCVSAEDRRCVFSIKILTDGRGLHRPGDTAIGDGFFIYEYPNGSLQAERHEGWHGMGAPQLSRDEVWGSGPEFTSRIRDIFRKTRIRDIDLKGTLLDSRDLHDGGLLVLGGRSVRIFADFENTKFTLTSDALGARLDFDLTKDARLVPLKRFLDQIALEYGRTKLLLN